MQKRRTYHENVLSGRSWHLSLAVILLAIVLRWHENSTVWKRPSYVLSMNKEIDGNPFYGMCYRGQPLLHPKAVYCDHYSDSLMKRILHGWVKPLNRVELRRDTLKLFDEITLSVVMPFHNLGIMTCQSLYELALDSLHFTTEFILVNDESDETEAGKVYACLKRLQHEFLMEYQIVENKKSIGYGPSCNHGAKMAHGNILLFANNDMFVGNGAIHAMIDTLHKFPQAGIVGPVFLGNDMIFQEMGGVIYQDASAANAYRGRRSIPKPLFMAHEVDYISAACLMIRKVDFDALGGFDKAYGRGYYEDTDLAMGVRQLGKRVILQPFAIAFHQEGGTFGSETPEKQKLMDRNKMIFFSKWEKELKVHTPPSTSPIESRERYILNPVLWADQYFITPSHDSGSQRTEQILKFLQGTGFQITFLPMTVVASEEIMPSIAKMRYNGIQILTERNTTICEADTNTCRFNLIFIARPYTFRDIQQDLQDCCKGVPVVYDTVDLHFLREARQRLKDFETDKTFGVDEIVDIIHCAGLATQVDIETCLGHNHGLVNMSPGVINHFRWIHSLMETELNSIRQSHLTLVVSEEERSIISKMGIPGSKLKILSNIYPDEIIDQAFQKILQTNRSNEFGAIFVGNFQHIPNIGAVESLVNITQVVSQAYPDFIMHIVGSHELPNDLMRRILTVENIVFHGWLSDEDLDLLYENVICAFIPLSTGAGVKGKVASAYLHGVPVVGSRIATEGMGFEDGRNFLLAEDPGAYLEAYSHIRSRTQQRNELTKRGIQVLQHRLSFSSAAKNLSTMLNQLGYYTP